MWIKILIKVQYSYFKNHSEIRQNNLFDQERWPEEMRKKGLPPCTGTAWLYGALLSSWLVESLWGRIKGEDSKGDLAELLFQIL